jgi:hypothetical protein
LPHQALVDERRHPLHHIRFRIIYPAAYRLDRLY